MGFFDFLFGRKSDADVSIDVRNYTKSLDNMSSEEIGEYFRNILATEFAEYTLKENVAVTELVGDACDTFKLYHSRPYQAYKAEWGQPYNFVMYLDGVAKAVVMFGRKGTHSEDVKYLIARMFAKKAGLPYINFYTNYPNEKEYVVERIKSFLNE